MPNSWSRSALLIYGALGYFIFPLDALADITPVVGYADDFGVLILALVAVAMNIDSSVKARAQAKLREWFGDNIDMEDIIDIEKKLA